MKAVTLRSFGGPDVLEPTDIPAPELHDGEVRIHVKAAGVNPVDYKIRSGSFAKADVKLPPVLGRDVAGVVESVGRGVSDLKVGDEVYAYLNSHSGGYAEFAIAKDEEVAPKPRSVDFVHAAAVPLAATTAWQALHDQGHLRMGQRVLIHGAGGGVGLFAVQFAKAAGAFVIATAAPEDLDLVKQVGADEVINYKEERFEQRTGPVDLVVDLVAGDTQARSWQVLKDGGALISTLQQPSPDQAAAHHARAAGAPHDTLEHQHSTGKIVLTVS
jgi:NADPH:quinone reductase-like Zn-dependent oxidoreductase